MRTLATFAAAFAAGIFLAQYLLPESCLLPGALACLALGALGWLLLRAAGHWRLRILLLCLGAAAAFGYNALYIRMVQLPMLSWADTERTVVMTLCDTPQETDWGAKVTVELADFSRGKAVYYGDKDLLGLSPGQRVTDTVSFQNAARIRDDDVTAFTSKGVFLMAYSRGTAVYGPGTMDSPRWWPQRVGAAVRDVIHSLFSGDTAGFLTAVLTGDTTLLSEEGKTALSQAGLYHILAVSGMHCGYLLAILALLLGRHRRRLLALLAMGVLWFYALLTGGSPSVVRACVMLSFLLLAPLLRRDSDPPTALFAALFLILLANPFAAASISLQLSFSAMAGMLFLTPRLYRLLTRERRQGRVARFIISSFSATMGALVFTVPLSGYYFGTLVLLSPLSNLLCLWMAGIIFFLGLLVTAVGAVCLPAAALLSPVLSLAVGYILSCAKVLSRIPGSAVYFADPYLKYWLAYVYLLFALVWFFGQNNRKKYVLAAVLAAVTLPVTVKLGELRYQSGLDVLVLDVGQGQCVLLKSGDSFALVDCGSGSSWYDAGDIAAAELRAMGCDSLDYLVLTHYDTDHVSGVESLLARIEVETMLLSPLEDDTGVQKEILALAESRGVSTKMLRQQSHLTFGDATVTVYPPVGEKTDNERGLSLYATAGTEGVFIPGDMSQKTERALLEGYRILPAQVLVAGHHGAKNATSEALLDVLQPKIACISVGSNRYGHPAEEVLQRLGEQGCAVYRTDQQGHIHIALDH